MDCRLVAEEELAEKYISGKLDPALQDEFEIHILECATCTALVELYEEARTGLIARQEELRAQSARRAVGKIIGPGRFIVRWLRWGASPVAWAAISLLIIVVSAGPIYLSYFKAHQSHPSQIAGPVYPAHQSNPSANPQLQAVPTPKIENPPLKTQHDAVLQNLQIDLGQPQIDGLDEQFSLEEANSIKHEIDTGKIAYPSELGQLRGSQEALLGLHAAASSEVLRPLAEVVVDGEPIFKWEALPGAVSYTVEIFGADLNPVQQSPALESTQWKPTAALESAMVYQWQVRATLKDGSTTVFPTPPRPEAKFRVLDKDRADYFTRFKRTYPRAHLLLGILYAHAGVLKDAEDELKQVPQDSGLYERAQALLVNLKATREAGH